MIYGDCYSDAVSSLSLNKSVKIIGSEYWIIVTSSAQPNRKRPCP